MIRRRAALLLALALAAVIASAAEIPVESLSSKPAWQIRVVADGVRFRTAPDPGAPALGQIARGEVLEVIAWSPVTHGFANEPYELPLPGFWIHAVDGALRRGWVASPFVVPVGAWPETPWLLGHIARACDSNSEELKRSGPEAILYFDTVQLFEGGAPHNFAIEIEDGDTEPETPLELRRRKNRETVDRLLASATSVTRFEASGTTSRFEVTGWAHTCEPYADGPGRGPSFDGGLVPERPDPVRLAAIGVDTTGRDLRFVRGTNFQSRPFFRFRDGVELRESLRSLYSFDASAPDSIEGLACTGPANFDARSTHSPALELWNCRFVSGAGSWSMLMGLHFPEGTASPFLLRLSRQLRDEHGEPPTKPPGDDASDWRVHAAEVDSHLDPELATDLNGDGDLELWFRSTTDVFNESLHLTWEIYFLRDDRAFGPWFVVVGNGGCC